MNCGRCRNQIDCEFSEYLFLECPIKAQRMGCKHWGPYSIPHQPFSDFQDGYDYDNDLDRPKATAQFREW